MLDTVKLCYIAERGLTRLAAAWRPLHRNIPEEYARVFRLVPIPLRPNAPQDPLFDDVLVTYAPAQMLVCVETSLPKVLFGTNARLIGERALAFVCDELDAHVAWGFLDELPTVATWSVRRADLCFDFRSRRFSFAAVRDAFLSLQPRGRRIAHRVGNGTVYFRSAGRRSRKRVEICFYDKAAEMRAHGGAAAICAAGVMRLEVRLVGQDSVRKAFRLGRPPTLAAIANRAAIHRVLLEKLRCLHITPGCESVLTGYDELAARVGAKRARSLWPFAQDLARMPLPDVCRRIGYSAPHGRRLVRELRSAGLYPAAVGVAGILDELVRTLSAAACGSGTAAQRCTSAPTEEQVPELHTESVGMG